MSSRCTLCYALGDRDTEDTSVATTRSREEIERHAEVHRKQIRFMIQEDANGVESGGASKESGAENGVSRNGGGRRSEDLEKSKTVEDHCRAIKLNSQMRDNNGVFCNLCESVKVVRQGQHLCAPKAMRHAQSHLGKMAYICGHCNHRTATAEAMRQHLKTQHKIVKDSTDHFDDKSGDYLEEIKEMITKCFESRTEPSAQQVNEIRDAVVARSVRRKENALDQSNEGKVRVQPDGPKKRGRPMDVGISDEKYTIIAHCRSILPTREKGCDAYALCNLCQEKKFVYTSSGSFRTDWILRHVQRHLGHHFYSCKLCDLQFNRNEQIQKHLREHHCVSSNAADNYEDKTGEFAQEIKDKITECFGGKMPQPSAQVKKVSLHSQQVSPMLIGTKTRDDQSHVRSHEKRPMPVSTIKAKVTGSKSQDKCSPHDRLARIRQDHCWRLVRNVKHVRRLQCKQCDVSVSLGTTRNNAPALLRYHVFSKHLPNLAVYRCRSCPFKTAVYSAMQRHFKRRHHSASITGKFRNHENDFHEEIMSELSACFDSSGSKRTMENDRNISKNTHSSMSKHRRPITDPQKGVNVGTTSKGLTSSTSRQDKSRDPFVQKIFDQCTELIRKTPAPGQMIECQLCSKVLAKSIWSLIRHVEVIHLQKANYACPHCPRRCVSIELMANHLRDQHQLSTTEDQYTYFAEENHEEMISLLKKCFDRDIWDGIGVYQGTTSISASIAAVSGPTTDDLAPTIGTPEIGCSNPSSSNKVSSSRMTRYKCQFCQSEFGHELIYKKHMAFFHSDAC